MSNQPIAFIAPFASLAAQATEVIRVNSYPVDVRTGDLGAGVAAALDAIEGGAKVIVSRGGTAKIITAALAGRHPVPVIEVEPSVYDAVRYIHANARAGFRVAIVGFSPFTIMGAAVCESMDVEHRVFEIADEETAPAVIGALAGYRADAVLGDAVSCRLMADMGWRNFHLVESSAHSIRDAFERAALVVNSLEKQLEYATRLHKKGFHARRRFSDIVHESPAVADTIAMAAEYAKSDANIIITGETGTGKELFAQGIHNASRRADGMFVAINCAALPLGLLESELFGYSPGAFTGALRSGKPGLFEIAHGGTLFLDEISEMDPFLQTRLLRAIQEGEIMRLGDSRVIPVDVRIIAAANRDLEEAVRSGSLREDLFFRLNVLSLRLPPLRRRGGDIALLFRHHLARHSLKTGIRARIPDAAFFRDLERHSWPGNVRELENLAERYLVLQDRPESADFSRLLPGPGRRGETEVIVRERPPEAAEPEAAAGGETLDGAIRRAIAKALAAENGNIVRASRRLGVNRNTLKRWMRKPENPQSPY